MGRNKCLSPFEQGQIQNLKTGGKSINEISMELGRGWDVVKNFIT